MKIFIGYDSKEIPVFYTCIESILEHAKVPLSIVPLKLSGLPMYQREDKQGTTEFSLTRFLVPYLSKYEGWSLFIDCDMIVKIDLSEIVNCIKFNPYELNTHFDDVYVVKHDYMSIVKNKATGINENYPKKNWSSVMLFNNEKCKILTPEIVNNSSPSYLHRLKWAKSVGELPKEYNWLVGEYPHNDQAKILHYTLGTPYFPDYKDSDHAEDWTKFYTRLK
jgi:hypothetical protein